MPDNDHNQVESTANLSARVDSIDLLRGLVMVIMALDHVRDFFSKVAFTIDPTNLQQTTTALFLTRWITHFCAPVFVFLAGTGAYLSIIRGKSRGDLSYFLFTRGVWLIFLEFTIIRLAWTFDLSYKFVFAQVIWVLGLSMVCLSVLIYLPLSLLTILSLLMIFTHNLFDPILAKSLGRWEWLWIVLHQPGSIKVLGGDLAIIYPFIPWLGVMSLGYCFGTLLNRDQKARIDLFIKLGVATIVAFIILRAINIYGDPQPWAKQTSTIFTLLSFINCQKYPPSLLYLLMTLGPAITFLAGMEKLNNRVTKIFITFGRVPLFYYILHLFLIHLLAVIISAIKYRNNLAVFNNGLPPDYGFDLPVVYLMWAVVVILLFPLCRWFADLKRRRKDAWLSYL